MIAPLKEILEDNNLSPEMRPKAKIAYRNAISMQNICNVMVELYERENEGRNLNVASYSLSDVMRNAIASTNELLQVAPIQIHYEMDKKITDEVWIDRKKIEHMFRNILSNAYRHISNAGNIHVNIYKENMDGKEFCCCQIQDDCKAIINQARTFLLSKEEGADVLTTQLKPELGIILMKENIVAHNGDIKIVQDPERGTCVYVYIPTGKEHFENNPNVTFVEAEEMKEVEVVTTNEEQKQKLEEAYKLEIDEFIPKAPQWHERILKFIVLLFFSVPKLSFSCFISSSIIFWNILTTSYFIYFTTDILILLQPLGVKYAMIKRLLMGEPNPALLKADIEWNKLIPTALKNS